MPSDGGKGSAPRPFSVDADTYASNWDRIFTKTWSGGVRNPVALPGCMGGCTSYTQCTHTTPCDRAEEWRVGFDSTDEGDGE